MDLRTLALGLCGLALLAVTHPANAKEAAVRAFAERPGSIKLQRDVAGRIVSFGVAEPSAAGLRAQSKTPAGYLAPYRRLLAEHHEAFGIDRAQDVPVLTIKSMMVGSVDSKKVDPGDIPNPVWVRVFQEVDGTRLEGGALLLAFADDNLRMVSGRLRSASAVRGRLEMTGVPASAGTAEKIARADCDLDDFEALDGGAWLLEGEDRLVRYYRCGQETLSVDLVERRVAARRVVASNYDLHAGGVNMHSVGNGSPTSASIEWLPLFLGLPPFWRTQTIGSILIDSERRPGSATNCNYRYTINGNPSPFPWPSTYQNDRVTYASGSCDAGGSAFMHTPSSSLFDVQVAHTQISTAARHALWQYNLRLFAWMTPEETHKLKVAVYNTPQNKCSGRAGTYAFETEDICLNYRIGGIYYWTTALHEYGHYVSDMYGLRPPRFNNNCRRKATLEGFADAMVVDFEHFRYGASNYSHGDVDELFVNGPGPGSGLGDDNIRARATTPEHLVTASSVPCDDDEINGPYNHGMMISQVLWKLLNNRLCLIPNTCTRAELGLSNISNVLSNAQVADIGRQALTHAVVNAGDNSDLQKPDAFLGNMLLVMSTYHRWLFNNAEWSRMLEAFAQNGVTP